MRCALMLVAITSLGACETKHSGPNGLDRYIFGQTTRGKVHEGICQVTDLNDGRKATWCFELPPFKVGQRTAEVDAYFLGTAETAPMIELQLKIRGCVENEADQWLRARFGAPL